MMEATGASAADTPMPSSPRNADVPLSAAVRELFSGLRAGAADVADLVAAEAHLALRLLVAMVLSAVGAAVLGVFGLAALVTVLTIELIARGVSVTMAIVTVALLCIVGSISLVVQLRVLARRVLFGHSRRHLRGEH